MRFHNLPCYKHANEVAVEGSHSPGLLEVSSALLASHIIVENSYHLLASLQKLYTTPFSLSVFKLDCEVQLCYFINSQIINKGTHFSVMRVFSFEFPPSSIHLLDGHGPPSKRKENGF